MPALRLPARLTRPRAGGDPPAAHRSRLGRTVRVLFLAVLLPPALWFFGPYAGGDRIAQITHPYEFHLVLWEAGQLGGRLPGLLQQLAAPPPADS
ncbi:MAG TPA: hypothetical protein VFB73_09055, partial [Chloroflexota bacterium]|nr:hypothetical protein [Chloroflexota bacterium]